MSVDSLASALEHDLLLTEQEKVEFIIHRPPVAPEGREYPLFCKILRLRRYNERVFFSVMKRVWDLMPETKVLTLKQDTYCFLIPNKERIEKIVARGPWSFENQVVLLDRNMVGLSPDEMKFNN